MVGSEGEPDPRPRPTMGPDLVEAPGDANGSVIVVSLRDVAVIGVSMTGTLSEVSWLAAACAGTATYAVLRAREVVA